MGLASILLGWVSDFLLVFFKWKVLCSHRICRLGISWLVADIRGGVSDSIGVGIGIDQNGSYWLSKRSWILGSSSVWYNGRKWLVWI